MLNDHLFSCICSMSRIFSHLYAYWKATKYYTIEPMVLQKIMTTHLNLPIKINRFLNYTKIYFNSLNQIWGVKLISPNVNFEFMSHVSYSGKLCFKSECRLPSLMMVIGNTIHQKKFQWSQHFSNMQIVINECLQS